MLELMMSQLPRVQLNYQKTLVCWSLVILLTGIDVLQEHSFISFFRISVWSLKSDTLKLIFSIQMPSPVVDYAMSPNGSQLAVYERLNSTETVAHQNLTVWNISGSEALKVASFSHKNANNWMPQWSPDDRFFGRLVSGEVHIYDAQVSSASWSDPSHRIIFPGITEFCLAVDGKCAIFIKEAGGKPGSVKIYNFASQATAILMAQKTFFKADRCRLLFSPSGRHLLAQTQTDVDKTGKSYYGESNLYFLSANGTFDCRVDLPAKGPIHDICWSPSGNEFVVVHGFMPSTTSLFDCKCSCLYTFACGAKNLAAFNRTGELLCFSGFGNLAGGVEVWRRGGGPIGRIGSFEAAGSTLSDWSPDGTHLITATLTPRLRVDNGFRIWTAAGKLLAKAQFGELYQVAWCVGAEQASIDKNVAVQTGELKKAAYRPPNLRKGPPAAPTENTNSPLSKTIKKLKEKLASIQVIKEKKAAGASLELDQIAKMEREGEIEAELATAMKSLEMQ